MLVFLESMEELVNELSFALNLHKDHLVIFTIGLMLSFIAIWIIIMIVRCLSGGSRDQVPGRQNYLHYGNGSYGLTRPPPPQSILDMAKLSFQTGNTDSIIRFVSKNSCDINSSLTSDGLNLFMCSCIGGEPSLIKFLLKNGGDVNQTTAEGNSVLYLATFGILKLAEMKNRETRARDEREGIHTLELLIKAGCDVNACNEFGFSALHLAISHHNVEIIHFLLRNNASAFATSKSGVTPMHLAASSGFSEAVRLMQRFSRET